MQASMDLQVYQQQQLLQQQQSTLVAQLMEVEARGTPSDVLQLQAKAMSSGTFGFGTGPLGEMDLAKEFSSPFIGKGINRVPKQPLIATHRVYIGIVKAWYASQKHGRIECEEIRAATGCDVYVYQDVLARGLAGVGDVVCFSVFTSKRGQLQASSPVVRTATHLGYAQTGIFRTGGPCDHKTDAGTIDCQEVRRVFGTEARVSKEMGKGLIFGRRVAFNAYMNDEGRVYVVSVEEVDEGFSPTPGNLTVSYSMPNFVPADGHPKAELAMLGSFVPFDANQGAGASGSGSASSSQPSREEIEGKRRRLEDQRRAHQEARQVAAPDAFDNLAVPGFDPAAFGLPNMFSPMLGLLDAASFSSSTAPAPLPPEFQLPPLPPDLVQAMALMGGKGLDKGMGKGKGKVQGVHVLPPPAGGARVVVPPWEGAGRPGRGPVVVPAPPRPVTVPPPPMAVAPDGAAPLGMGCGGARMY
mmetsp:Transcript_95809/g.310425  ORF Transcript_95809/g.310425 Transcript_95809/m.310425 type:complete len:470 (+) Transcript_95809:3-1412(+)